MIIEVSENIAVLRQSGASVFIARKGANVAPLVKKITNVLDVAPWGEDNRFPQNIVESLAASGVAQSTLAWKARSIWGSGICYGTVEDVNEGGSESFKVAKRGEFPQVDKFFQENNIPRFYAEFNMDLVYFGNCFPELILTKNKQEIAGLIHQESADCRYSQMNDKGEIEWVYISKLWGMTKDQFVKFDPKKKLKGLSTADLEPTEIDNKFLIKLPCADMYYPHDWAKDFFASNTRHKSFILPVNFPSPNKTYYQLVSWDGCRRGGWIEISAKIPEMLKMLYNNAFNIRYHIEIPETYFEKRYGQGEWAKMDAAKRRIVRNELMESMDAFLAGSENAYKTFTSYFDIDNVSKNEYGRIKITPVTAANNTDKDLLLSGTANSEIMFSMGVNPNILGAGKPGGVYASNQGGSNIREGKLEHDSNLHLERQMALEPLNFIKRFNNWPENLEFRFRDTVLTTLDTGKQTETQIK